MLTCDETGELGAGALRDSQVRWSLTELRFSLKLQLQRLQCLLCLYNNKEQKQILMISKNTHHYIKKVFDIFSKTYHKLHTIYVGDILRYKVLHWFLKHIDFSFMFDFFLTIHRAQACRSLWFRQYSHPLQSQQSFACFLNTKP